MKLPDGFAPVSFAAFDAQHPQMLPEVLASLVGEIKGTSLADGRNVIAKMAQIGVLQFARNVHGTPAVFTAADAVIEASLAAPSSVDLTVLEKAFGRKLIDAVVRWFDASGTFDYATGVLAPDPRARALAGCDRHDMSDAERKAWFAEIDAFLVLARQRVYSRAQCREVTRRLEASLAATDQKRIGALAEMERIQAEIDSLTVVDEAHPLKPGYVYVPVEQWLQDSAVDVGKIAQNARLSRHVAADCFRRLERAGYLRIQRRIDRQRGDGDGVYLTVPDASVMSRAERALAESMSATTYTEQNGRITLGNGPANWPKEATQVKQIQNVRTPNGVLPLVRQTAEKLLKEGVISGTLDGDLHAADAATVKAAIMSSQICDFCSSPGATHYFDVPDFGISKNDNPDNFSAAKSTGGWMACDDCDALITADKRKQLVERAVNNMAFPKFSRRMVEELYAKFWQGMDERVEAAGLAQAVGEFVDDRMPRGARPVPAMSARDKRVEATVRMTGLTREEVEAAAHGGRPLGRSAVEKLVRWRRQFSKTDPATMIDLLASGVHKPLADVVPHWQRALDAKFQAIANIAAIVHRSDKALSMVDAIDMNDPTQLRAVVEQAGRAKEMRELGFADDIKSLRVAQAYSFNSETASAIREAARSVPHDAPLSSIETPNTGAGWFWFSEALPFSGTPAASEATAALLWSWENVGHESAALRFSGFIVASNAADARVRGKVLPSTKWWWPLEMSFEDMLAHNRAMHQRDYGEGGRRLRDGMSIAGEDETLRVVSELSLFFVMACLWFRQTVPTTGRKIDPKLTRENGPVERQARKRIAKEHDLDALPSVQVVALRKSQRTAIEDAPAERQTGARDYHCRWIVQGHPRMQACGPGRKDRKLIWIDAHVAGPEGKPLRTRERVYAVVR